MSKAGEHTHSQLLTGAISGNPLPSKMGTLTLPAGGPWIIHHVYGQIIKVSNTDPDTIVATFYFQPAAGDFSPNPTPSFFPFDTTGKASASAVNMPQSTISLFPVFWTAPGSAQLEVFTAQRATSPGNLTGTIGILYSARAPQQTFPTKYAQLDSTINSTNEEQLGTIQLAQSSRRLLGIHGHMEQEDEIRDDDIAVGTIRLDSADLALSPLSFPFQTIYGPAPTASFQAIQNGAPFFIPLDIPVPKGARIDVFTTWADHFTVQQMQQVYLAYE